MAILAVFTEIGITSAGKSQGKKSVEFYQKKTHKLKQEPIQIQSKFMKDKRDSMPARFRAHGEIRSSDL